jgi:hypothetical protein
MRLPCLGDKRPLGDYHPLSPSRFEPVDMFLIIKLTQILWTKLEFLFMEKKMQS